MKLGVIGTGAITKSMLAEYQRCNQFEINAICSRKQETGQAMAEAFSIPKVYTDLQDMLADPEIEVVYVATPNIIHFRQAKAALLAGKHVICEKPFTPTVAEAEELIALAKEKHLLLFEAITTAHHPGYGLVKDLLPKLGSLKVVMATFCQFSSRYPALMRGEVSPVLDPAYKGGALMDINLYNIHFVVGLFGKPESVHYYPNIYKNGVDTSGLLVLQYPGFICQCVGAKDCAADNGVQLVGEDGRIFVGPTASFCQTVDYTPRGGETQKHFWEENAWYHEVQDLGRLFAEKDYDACYKALDTTLNVVTVLEAARKAGNLGF